MKYVRRKRQIPYDFIHVEFKKQQTNNGKGRKNKIKSEKEANHKRLLNTEKKLGVARGEVVGEMG